MTQETAALLPQENRNIPARTPDMIASEIIAIKTQTRKFLLISAVEIGRRLKEAKDLIPYGEYVAWLKEAVQYSERTAYKLMQLAEEFGPHLAAGPGANPEEEELKTSPFAALSYSQALVLLGLPEEDRAEFIAEFDLENTAVHELEQAVQERKKLLAENAALLRENLSQKSSISKLSSDLDKAKDEAQKRKQELWTEQGNVTMLKRRIEVLENESAAAKHVAEVERNLKIAKLDLSKARADARFDLIVKGLDDLLADVKEMAVEDPIAFHLYLNQVNQLLSKTAQRFKRLKAEMSAN